MNSFSIQGYTGFLKIEFTEVFGFPTQTSHFGGYDTKSNLTVESKGFSVNSNVWLSTGEVFNFYKSLKSAHQNLVGFAKFESSENDLSFTISYARSGQVNIFGEFRGNGLEDNFLRFEMSTDQSYLNRTIVELGQIYEKYGDSYGKNASTITTIL